MFLSIAATIAWIVMLVLAVINGALREKYLNLRYGYERGHIISTMILCIVIFLISYFYVLLFGRGYDQEEMLNLGIYWLILTTMFEFLFGHYVAGHSWDKLLADYNLFKGRIWVLVLITTLVGPLLSYYLIMK